MRNLGSALVIPSINIYKHKKNKKSNICVITFNRKDKNNESIINDLRFQINMRRNYNYEIIENEDDNSSSCNNMEIPYYEPKYTSLNTYCTVISKEQMYSEKNKNKNNNINNNNNDNNIIMYDNNMYNYHGYHTKTGSYPKKIISFHCDPIILNFSKDILKNVLIFYNTFCYFINNCSKNDDTGNDSNMIRDMLYYLYNQSSDILFEYFLDDIRLNCYDGNINRNVPLIVVSLFNLKFFLQKDIISIYNFLNFYLNIDIYDSYKILYDTLLEKMEIYLTFENNRNKLNILNLTLETSYINILYTNKSKNILINFLEPILNKNFYYFSSSYYNNLDITKNKRRKRSIYHHHNHNYHHECYENNILIKNTKGKSLVTHITSKIFNYTGLSINVRFKQSLRNKIQNNSLNNKNKNKYLFYELQNNEHGALLNDENGEVCEVVVIIKNI